MYIGYIMEIWTLCYLLPNDRRGTVVLSGGEGPTGDKFVGGPLKFKNQCRFQYDTTKVNQF